MRSFHMREFVRIADPDDVAIFRDVWLERTLGLFGRLGLVAESEVASDPFFGRVGRMLAANQKEQELKFELVAMVGGPEPTAIASFNYHQDHFTQVYEIGLEGRGRPHRLRRLRDRASHPRPVPGARPRPPDLAGRGARGAVAVSGPTSGLVSLFGHDPATYRPHAIHTGERTYLETNCFTDIISELLHARGDEPVASFGSFVRMDFENDQWTFFKPRPGHGAAVRRRHPRDPAVPRIPHQVAEQLALGRTMTIELDGWYLPDTAATSYGTGHVKTGVIAEAIDLAGNGSATTTTRPSTSSRATTSGRLPNRGGVVAGRPAAVHRADPVRRRPGHPRPELHEVARGLLRGHLDRVPPGNPFDRFADRLSADLPSLLAGDAALYHAFTFATFRMAGAGFELLASHAEWLLGERAGPATDAMGASSKAARSSASSSPAGGRSIRPTR